MGIPKYITTAAWDNETIYDFSCGSSYRKCHAEYLSGGLHDYVHEMVADGLEPETVEVRTYTTRLAGDDDDHSWYCDEVKKKQIVDVRELVSAARRELEL